MSFTPIAYIESDEDSEYSCWGAFPNCMKGHINDIQKIVSQEYGYKPCDEKYKEYLDWSERRETQEQN